MSDIQQLPLEEKVGQLVVAGFKGIEPPDYILEWLAAGRIGGVILFARNVESPAQLAALTRACHEAAPRPILIGIDQEGGTVARLRQSFTESPGAMALGAAGDEALAERVAHMMAVEMRALGINWDYAPVVDLTYNITNASVGTRSFGADMTHVSRMASACVRGFQRGGVAACAKHFPGLGNTPVDTHNALAVIDTPAERIAAHDLPPYRAVIDAGVMSIMTTHAMITALDDTYPATLSPVVINTLLRDQLGFDGVVATDCMEMNAITDGYGPWESAILAAQAGVDIVHFSHTRSRQEEAYEGLLSAARSGRLPETRINEALERIARMKAAYAVEPGSDLSVVGCEAHQTLALEAARAGTVLLRDDAGLLPLKDENQTVLVEFASYMETGALESGGLTGLAALLNEAAPRVKSIALNPTEPDPEQMGYAQTIAAGADVLVLATRSAHLSPPQLEIARRLMNMAQQVVLLCLRNPYDAGALPGAQAVICTCGDSTPSLQAAVDALLGKFTPQGRLPVSIEAG
jgi:beta-N-acetylhexosaminidase